MSGTLFSPVDYSDMMDEFSNGPLFYIIYSYKPEKIYLFFANEDKYSEERKQRLIKKLGTLIEECQIQFIKLDIDDPWDYDTLYWAIRVALDRIIEIDGNNEIFINLSSTNVSVVSALSIIAASSRNKLIPLLVTPDPLCQNKCFCVPGFSDDSYCSTDPQVNTAEIRCIRPGITDLRKSIVKTQVEVLLKDYEYSAALNLLKASKHIFTNYELLKKLLNHSHFRINLKNHIAKKCIKNLEIDFQFYPIKEGELAELIEFFYVIKVKQRKGDLSDLALKVTPFTTELLKVYLSRLGILPQLITRKPYQDIYFITRGKLWTFDSNLLKYLDNRFKKKGLVFQDSYLKLEVLYYIVNYLYNDVSMRKKHQIPHCIRQIKILLNFELHVRNKLAHSLALVTEESFKYADSRLNNSSDLIVILEELVTALFPEYSQERFIYKKLNKYILSNLE